jgi:hypothetical protein
MKKEFTNEETAEVHLAFNSDPYAFIPEQAEEEDFELDTSELQTFDYQTQKFAKRIKDGFERNTPDVEGVYGSLLAVALDKVNWHEVAAKFISDTRDAERRLQDGNVLDSEIIQ